MRKNKERHQKRQEKVALYCELAYKRFRDKNILKSNNTETTTELVY